MEYIKHSHNILVIKFTRGSDWRGKDCSDIDPFIYPGAQTQNFDSKFDGNCISKQLIIIDILCPL